LARKTSAISYVKKSSFVLPRPSMCTCCTTT